MAAVPVVNNLPAQRSFFNVKFMDKIYQLS